MGFTAPVTVVPLTFGDPSLEGLEVWMGTPSIQTIGDMMMLGGINSETLTGEDVKRLVNVCDAFVDALVRWNVDADVLDTMGIPTGEKREVPATAQGVASLDGNFLLRMVLGWVQTVTGQSWKIENTAAIPMDTTED